MGVPALFRWLSKKYPKIISPVIEEKADEIDNGDGTKTQVPVDMRKPNPNGEEFDNLYLDMNGIVHPCSHPEDRPPPANEEEMMIAIFEFTERVVNMARPRKLLYIAVDGVAPRAKMNQQRSRRFRSAQEAAEKDKQTEEFHALLKTNNQDNGDDANAEAPKKTWDSNNITPGTPFMDLLAESLRYWTKYKLSTDPAWENLKVIISDASVPGEGEHKIMNFIRSQRSSGMHDPNTRHVFVGLDADLIMLGIATHEPHFRVLREDVFANDAKPGHCRKCNQPGHKADECRGTAKPKPGEEGVEKPQKPFIWLNVGTLREYLAIEMHVPGQPFKFDLERALDDWVFMCFFVGNDFLPHLPSLDIREDGIDTLIAIWRDNIPVMNGYVTKDGHVDLERAQIILEGLAKQEDAIFKRRREADLKRQENEKRRAEQQEKRQGGKRMRFSDGAPTGFDETVIRRGARGGIIRGEGAPNINALPTFAPGEAQTRSDPRYAAALTHADVVGGRSIAQANADNKSAAAALKEKLMQSKKPADNQKAELDALMADANANGAEASGNGNANEQTTQAPVLGKRTRDMIDEANDDVESTNPSTPGRNTPPNKEVTGGGTSGALGGNSQEGEGMPEDTVRLWEDGYQVRYYEQKFHVAPNDIEFRRKVARSYVEGLCWVLLYYFQGCPSWTWYFPYHYAPFAADFKDIDKMRVEFDKGTPFRPYEQLMGVMPPASNHTLPKVFHPLMTDEDSPIKEFYPLDFEVDLNGKKFAWQGVALLPFIDEKKLLAAMKTVYPELTDEEHRRNDFGDEVLVFSVKHPLYDEVVQSLYSKKAISSKTFKLDTWRSQGLSGKVGKDGDYVPGSDLVFPLESGAQDKYTSIDQDTSASITYHMPVLHQLHKSMLLPGVRFPEQVLDYNDVQATREKASRTGRKHGGVQLSQNGDRSDGRRINYAARDGFHSNNGPPPPGVPPPPPGWGYPPQPMYPQMHAPPAPPQNQYQQNGYGQYVSQQNIYGDQGYGGHDSYRGYAPAPAPPPMQQQRNHYVARGGRGGYGGHDSRYGGYDNRNGGYGGYDNRGNGYGRGYGGGYGNGRR